MRAGGDCERRLPDEVVFKRRDQACIAAGGADGEPVADAEAALQIDLKRDTESVKTGPEIGARAGYAKNTSRVQFVLSNPA